jgi:hypothetical protein
MGDTRFTLRTWFMMFVAFAITVLFIMASTALWRHNLWETILFLSLGTTLTFLFYRKKLALLAAGACGLIVVNGGLTAVFHPSLVGILVTLASFVGLVFFSRRVGKQHPGLLADDWRSLAATRYEWPPRNTNLIARIFKATDFQFLRRVPRRSRWF